jgi:two-component system sensor histidine kinase HydH
MEPVLAERLEASALKHLVVSSGAAALLILLALFFLRMAARAERAEAALARQRRLAALGEMSAVLGHELMNPLAALKGHAQLVLERTEPEAKARRNAERVVLEAERLEALTAQILDFARTGAVHAAAADPVAMLTSVADKHKGAARAAFDLDVARAPARWEFDRARMEQVLDNLVDNAVQASPPGAPIELACEESGDDLVLAVRDRGPGFPPGEETTAFEPFRTTRVKGTGLGLAIARRIVEAHGGRIRAENPVGGGARVEVRLPRAGAAEAARGGER